MEPGGEQRVTGPAARPADLPPGALAAAVLSDGTAVCLANVDGEVCAVADRCTHAAFPLSQGDLLADGSLQCAWHGARFDARTGAVLAGPATEPVAAYAVRVAGDAMFVGARRGDR